MEAVQELPTKESKFSKLNLNKRWWGVLATLAIGAVALAAFLYTNSFYKSPLKNNGQTATNSATQSGQVSGTENWNTYTNQELGFSFRYPKEWGEVNFSIRDAQTYGSGKFFFGGFTKYDKMGFGGSSNGSSEPRGITYSDFQYYAISNGDYLYYFGPNKAAKVLVTKTVDIGSAEPALIINVKGSNGDSLSPIFNTVWHAAANLGGQTFKGIAFAGYSSDDQSINNYELVLKTLRIVR